jgi:hypothetical protein
LLGALLFAGIGLIGMVLLIQSTGDLFDGWRSQQWTKVSGEVIESHRVTLSQIRSTNPAYEARVTYQYEIHGKRFTNQLHDFGKIDRTDAPAVDHDLAHRYFAGAVIDVWVNPNQPSQAVIEPGIQPKACIHVGLGLVFLIISAWQLIALCRDWEGDQLVSQSEKTSRSQHKRVRR